MQLAERRSASAVEFQPHMRTGLRRVPSVPSLDVVLKPLSHPKLGELRVDDAEFTIGRTEDPFVSYANDVINMMSRRHARIFRKDGLVYLADMGSRNGTTINRAKVGSEPCQLHDGDEISLGGALSYQVQITPRVRHEGIRTLTLTPASDSSGLDPIVITKLPFLVSKTEATFSRYKGKSEHGQELGYLSRRQAHIFQKGSEAYIEDLGSGNGTFVDGVRLVDQAVPLSDGVVVAFGGSHFVYRVTITRESSPEAAHIGAREPRAERKSAAEGVPLAQQRPATQQKPAGEGKPLADQKLAAPQAPAAEGKALAEQKPAMRHGPADEGKPLADRRVAAPQKPVAKDKPLAERKLAAEGKPLPEQSLAASQRPASEAKTPAELTPARQQTPAAEGKPLAEQKAATQQKPVAEGQPLAERKPATQHNPAAERKPLADQKLAVPQKPAEEHKPNVPQAYEGTQFMAAPTSFLTILCETDEPKDDVALADSAAPVTAARDLGLKRGPRNRVMLLLSELASLNVGGDPDNALRMWWKVAAVAGVLIALVSTAYFWSASERDLNNAVARGEYAKAATLATRLLEKHPDDLELKARATEAGLKAHVPEWLGKIKTHDFDAAKGVLAGMSELGKRDSDLRPLIDELGWLGNLERVVSVRGGPDAPIRIYADEDSIEHLVGRWNEDTGEHQRALARIAGYVPQFRDWYGEALTHLRRLQSESTVYLPVIERIKSNVATELEKDNPEELDPVLKEAAERYPSLGGVDNVRQDLARYIEIRKEVRTRKSGRLFALVQKTRFVTPPFEQSFRGLMASGQLPSTALLQQYSAATQAWKEGNSTEALAQLEKMTTGAWGEDAAKELARRRSVTDRFAAMQESRNASGFVDQLLAFRESLDADEDLYFLHATAADLNLQKEGVLARAQDAMNRARTLWHEYQSNGAIDASQRIETSISNDFRNRAHLLADANKSAQQGFLIYSQVDPAGAAQWTAIREEIESEAREQISRLHELSNVVEPGLLKAKLGLLGEPNE